jgi:hypothetical protein
MDTRNQLMLRIGAAALIISSICVLIFRTLHGDLPAEEGGAASLGFVASYPIYRVVHLGDVLGFLMFAAGLLVLSESLTQDVAWIVGRLGVASALIGVAVHITEFSIDGYALTTLGDIWSVASATERPHLEFVADLAVTMLGGPATVSLGVVWGTTLMLYGFALTKEGYPRWLGWTGTVVGASLFAMAIAKFLRPNLFAGVILYGGGTWAAHVWALAVGAAMWRRAHMLGARPAPSTPH